jgi:hypothetical protein
MEMLATWILLRCNRQNPQNKEMGYKMTFKPEGNNNNKHAYAGIPVIVLHI